MENTKSSTLNKWYLLSIEDKKGLPGNSILEILQHVLHVIQFKYVIIEYLSGAVINSLIQYENQPMELEIILDLLPNVKQFDWGDFFLFREYPMSWENNKKTPYHKVISQTETTIRAIDDTYIYIYLPISKL